MSIAHEEEVVLRGKCDCSVACDGCYKGMLDGDRVFCEECRTLPDRHVEPREAADYLREWTFEQRHELTAIERELLERVADRIVSGQPAGLAT